LQATCGHAVRREDRSRPWEESVPPLSSAPASTASTPSRRRRLPPRRRAAPPFFTNACTTARGHQGENELSPWPLWTPHPSSRRGTRCSHRTAAPPPLVMPAIEPDWDDFLAGVAALTDMRARHSPTKPSPSSRRVPCRPGRRCDPTPARSCSRARPCGHVALAQACTPARVRPSSEGEAGPLALFLVPDLDVAYLSVASPWPHRESFLRARGHREGSAVLLVGECTPRHRPPFPHTRVCARTAVALSTATHGTGLSSVVSSTVLPIYSQRRA
jgi:hypothetical protein